MDIAEIDSRIVGIRKLAIDEEEDEAAHKAEMQLWEKVLEHIAAGGADAQALAARALESRMVSYVRGYQ